MDRKQIFLHEQVQQFPFKANAYTIDSRRQILFLIRERTPTGSLKKGMDFPDNDLLHPDSFPIDRGAGIRETNPGRSRLGWGSSLT